MINQHAVLVVKRHGKVFWQFFTDNTLAIDAYYIYACDHSDYNYTISLTNGEKIGGYVPSDKPTKNSSH